LLKGPLPVELLFDPQPTANASNPHNTDNIMLLVNCEGKISQEKSEAALAIDTTTPPALGMKVSGFNPRSRAKLRTIRSARAPRPASSLPPKACLYRIRIYQKGCAV
jgi:hypothetical protein